MTNAQETATAQESVDGPRRLQRNFGISEDTAEWLRVAAFQRNVSQSQLAREAFDLLQEKYSEIRLPAREPEPPEPLPPLAADESGLDSHDEAAGINHDAAKLAEDDDTPADEDE
jgi:hypothetical protein